MTMDNIRLNKVKTPISSDRLALENDYATSLFGVNYELPAFTPIELTKKRYEATP